MSSEKERSFSKYIKISKGMLNDLSELIDNIDSVDKLFELFEKTGPIEDFHTNLRALAFESNLSENLVDSIIHTIFGLISLNVQLNINNEGFIETLIYNIKNQAEENWKKKYLDKLVKISSKLLFFIKTDNSFYISQKSILLSNSHQNVFRDAKIFTDLRPVFNESGDDIFGTIVSHNFIVDYYERNNLKQIILTLDDSDLDKILKLCMRAKTKTNTISSMSNKLPGETIILGRSKNE